MKIPKMYIPTLIEALQTEIADLHNIKVSMRLDRKNCVVFVILNYGNIHDFRDFEKDVLEKYLPAGFLLKKVDSFEEV